MTTLAGVDPTAQTGVTGDVERTEQMERAIESTESSQERKREIDHTNITMSLDVLTRQYIYNGTYQWRTSDAPGTLIAAFPIHPDACNMYTAHVYKCFGAYVGGMKARMRIIGTAFFGGGLYLVRVPPQYQPSDIQKFGLAGVTAFPHTDIDPKNLDSVDVLLEDFRSEHFHTGPLNTNDSKSFGGWLAIVVNARLVTQSEEIRSVDLRMEFAGDFHFQVPVPIRTVQTETQGPITDGSFHNMPGVDDTIYKANTTQPYVLKSSETVLKNGTLYLRSAGGEYTYNNTNSSVVISNGTWEDLTKYRISPHSFFDNDPEVRVGPGNLQVYALGYNNGLNIKGNSLTFVGTESAVVAVLTEPTSLSGSKPIYSSKTEMTVGQTGRLLITPNAGSPRGSADLIRPTTSEKLAGESIMFFHTNQRASVNATTAAFNQDLAAFSEWPNGSAALYNLFNKDGTMVAVAKLRRSGLWYVAASDSEMFLDADHLTFRQWVPDNEPIPVIAAYTRAMLKSMIASAVQSSVAALSINNARQ